MLVERGDAGHFNRLGEDARKDIYQRWFVCAGGGDQRPRGLPFVAIVKSILRLVWRTARPVREALASRFDQHLDRHLGAWFARVQRAQADENERAANMQLVADALVRELVRLQSQVQRLEEAVERQTNEAEHLQDIPPRRQVA
jgi:hypothetical protein